MKKLLLIISLLCSVFAISQQNGSFRNLNVDRMIIKGVPVDTVRVDTNNLGPLSIMTARAIRQLVEGNKFHPINGSGTTVSGSAVNFGGALTQNATLNLNNFLLSIQGLPVDSFDLAKYAFEINEDGKAVLRLKGTGSFKIGPGLRAFRVGVFPTEYDSLKTDLQAVLNGGDTLTKNNTINIGNNQLNVSSTGATMYVAQNSIYLAGTGGAPAIGTVNVASGIDMASLEVPVTLGSRLYIRKDSIHLSPRDGKLSIAQLEAVVDTTGEKLVLWNPVSGRVRILPIGVLGNGGVSSFNGRTGAVSPATNDYTWAQINKSTSSLADITTRSAADLSSGTLPDARLSSNVVTLTGSQTLSNKSISGSANTLTNIGLGSLVQGGAISGEVLKWNGSAWAPATDATGGGGGGDVASVFGRTGVVTAQSNDYTWAQIGSKPTTLSTMGITDGQPLNSILTSLSGVSATSGLLKKTGATTVGTATAGTDYSVPISSTDHLMDVTPSTGVINTKKGLNALTSGTSITMNLNTAVNNTLSLAHNAAISVTNEVAGDYFQLWVTQTTGGNTITIDGQAVDIDPAASAMTYVVGTYNGSVWVISTNLTGATVDWADITGKPTTLAAAGITDAQPLNSQLTALAGGASTGLMRRTGAATYTYGTAVGLTSEVTGRLPYANFVQGSALSVLGVTGNATADYAAIAAGSDGQVLRRNGTALGFGALNLGNSNAITGTLPFGNGGTGLSSLGTANQLLRVNSGATALEYFTPSYITGNQSISWAPTGDVTGSTSGTTSLAPALTIANDVVTYAKMQNVSATSRIMGRITAGAGDMEELTGTQATSLLDVFTTSVKGLVPAATGGSTTTNWLRKDGTWTKPPGFDHSEAAGNLLVSNGSGGAASGVAANLVLGTLRVGNNALGTAGELLLHNGVGGTGALLKITGGATTINLPQSDPAADQVMVMDGTSNPATWKTLNADTYTPTVASSTNISSTNNSTYGVRWQQIGDIVFVTGNIAATATATGNTTIELTLPIASNFTAVADCGGTAFMSGQGIDAGSNGQVAANTTGDTASINYYATVTTSRVISFNFSYTIK